MLKGNEKVMDGRFNRSGMIQTGSLRARPPQSDPTAIFHIHQSYIWGLVRQIEEWPSIGHGYELQDVLTFLQIIDQFFGVFPAQNRA